MRKQREGLGCMEGEEKAGNKGTEKKEKDKHVMLRGSSGSDKKGGYGGGGGG